MGCLQLVDVVAEGKPLIAQLERHIDQNPPAVFHQLASISAESEEATTHRQDLDKLHSLCNLEAKLTWNEWREKYSQGVTRKLQENVEILQKGASQHLQKSFNPYTVMFQISHR